MPRKTPSERRLEAFLRALAEYGACYPDDTRVALARSWATSEAVRPKWKPKTLQESAQYKKVHLDVKLLFSGLHLLDGERLVQVRPPLPGYEYVVANVLRSGVLSYYDSLEWKVRYEAMPPGWRIRYGLVGWADGEVRKARAAGREPHATALGILHKLGLIDARGAVLYPIEAGEGNAAATEPVLELVPD